MATRSVRFEYQCGRNPEKLVEHHEVPAVLIREDAQEMVSNDPKFAQLLNSTMLPIIRSNQVAHLEKANQECAVCSKPSVSIIHVPSIWLHVVDDPSMSVIAIGYCGRMECEMVTRQRAQAGLRATADLEGVREWRASRPGMSPTAQTIPICRICEKTEGSKFCQRCMMVAYCGKEHQKEDWKRHKKICAALANGSAAL